MSRRAPVRWEGLRGYSWVLCWLVGHKWGKLWGTTKGLDPSTWKAARQDCERCGVDRYGDTA